MKPRRGARSQAAKSVAIVGAGPRGLQCLASLIEVLRPRSVQKNLTIYVFHSSEEYGRSFVCGSGAPAYFPMNSDNPAEIERFFQSLVVNAEDRSTDLPDGEMLTRNAVGQRLATAFNAVFENAPHEIEIVVHRRRVIDLVDHGSGIEVIYSDGAGRLDSVFCAHVVLCTGHGVDDSTSDGSIGGPGPIPAFGGIYGPYNSKGGCLSDTWSAEAEQAVAVQGIGLTAIDVLLTLTEGRGGVFTLECGAAPKYQRSGAEPAVIYPFSRTGLPVVPKFSRVHRESGKLRVFTPERIRACSPGVRRLEWHQDLDWMMMLEFEYQFYLSQLACGDEPAESWFRAHDLDSPAALRSRIETYRQAGTRVDEFQPDRLLSPFEHSLRSTHHSFSREVASYLQAALDPAECPGSLYHLGIGLSSWYEISQQLSTQCLKGKLEGTTHVHIAKVLAPRMRRVAYGATVLSIKKLLALVECGVVDFSVAINPKLIPLTSGRVVLRSAALGSYAEVDTVVRGYVPPFDVLSSPCRLYQNLLRRGIVRAHRVEGPVPDGRLATGAIEIDADSACVVGSDGRINIRVAAIGVPTEGQRLNTWFLQDDEYPALWALRAADVLR